LFLVFVVERTAHRTYAVEFKIRVFGFSFHACVNRLRPRILVGSKFLVLQANATRVAGIFPAEAVIPMMARTIEEKEVLLGKA
jgi:hypothetical protein